MWKFLATNDRSFPLTSNPTPFIYNMIYLLLLTDRLMLGDR